MPEFTSQERIELAAKLAHNASVSSGPEYKTASAVRGILELMLAQAEEHERTRTDAIGEIERAAYDRGWDAGQDEVVSTREALFRLLPRVESLEVRADLAEALGTPLAITPEEPDPGRDWSRVEAHLFKPGGKWKYRVWLDYTGERFRDVPGEGPHGWHFDGAEMAHRALSRATANGTSGVSIREDRKSVV